MSGIQFDQSAYIDKHFDTIMWRINAIIMINGLVAAGDGIMLSSSPIIGKYLATFSLSVAILSSAASYTTYKQYGKSYKAIAEGTMQTGDDAVAMLRKSFDEIKHGNKVLSFAEGSMLLHVILGIFIIMGTSYGWWACLSR